MKPSTELSHANEPVATNPLAGPILIGLLSWGAISLGFYGLTKLMQARPEFVGAPIRTTTAGLVQDSPQLVARKVSDDVAVIKPAQPELSDVRFDLAGRRDYRGLRTLLDMSGQFNARYVLTNAYDEPCFFLFKCPHPGSQSSEGQNLVASELQMHAPEIGVAENTAEAWTWSGGLAAHQSAEIKVSYRVASLKSITYRVVDKIGGPLNELRVTVQRKDLPTMRFESGEGSARTPNETVVWEKRDFLAPDFFTAEIGESRNLFVALSQLLEIGPLICLLFLVAVSAAILVRQRLTALQLLTIACGYALYFPLLLYLSSRFSFLWALLIATVVPGVMLINFARWLLGSRLGLLAAPVFLLLYQVFPTLAAFAGWNRGMVLLWLGVITMAVLINLQNRALRQRAVTSAVALVMLCASAAMQAAEVQVTLPAELVAKPSEVRLEVTNTLMSFAPAHYRIKHQERYFQVEAEVPLRVLRAGKEVVPLFGMPVHLQKVAFDPADFDGHLVTSTNQVALFAPHAGAATMRLTYRVPVLTKDGKERAQVPAMVGASGSVTLESDRANLEVLSGQLWSKKTNETTTLYDIGLAGVDQLLVEWREQDAADTTVSAPTQTAVGKEFYGIGLTRAQNLTVLNSDGSCLHFAEFELPVLLSDEFHLKLPAQARLISVSVDGAEITSPAVANQLCAIRLPARQAQQSSHRVSVQIEYPAMRLGFVGMVELKLPEFFHTVGTLEWVVVLPVGFETQVLSSGLERQNRQAELASFGDYGRILKQRTHTYLSKTLAPPGVVSLSLKYRQTVPGF